MKADELARLLNSGADGLNVVEDVMTPVVCKGLAEILHLLRTGQMVAISQGKVMVADGEMMRAVSKWDVNLDRIIGILGTLADFNESGNNRKMAQSLRRFSERRRMLGLVGKFIR